MQSTASLHPVKHRNNEFINNYRQKEDRRHEAMHNDDAKAKRKRKSSSVASPAQSPATAIAPTASANSSATSLSIAVEASADGALVTASAAAAATAPRLHTVSSSSTTTTPALSAVQKIAPPLPFASATPSVASPEIALKGTATASLTTAQDIASTAIDGYALRSNDSSTSPDSNNNNEGSVIGPKGIVSLDGMFQNKLENDLATTSSIDIDDYLLPTGTTTENANRDVENRFLAMTKPDGKPMWLTKSSTPNQLGPRRQKDQVFHDNLPEKMKLVRKGMSDKELKQYGRVSIPPRAFAATVIDDHRFNPGGSGSGEKICVAAMVSVFGTFPHVRDVPGPDGALTRYKGSRSGGDADPRSVYGMLGGDHNLLNKMTPGEILTGYRRNMFDLKCYAGEEDPEFIAKRQEAEGNKDKLARALELCETNTKRNNGLKSGASLSLYEIIPSPDATNKEDDDEIVVKAKARGDKCLAKALAEWWEPSTSDNIPRFKGKKKKFSGKDVATLLEKNNRARINGYIVAKFQSFEEYDECNVSDNMTFDSVLHGGQNKLPKALPKRELLMR